MNNENDNIIREDIIRTSRDVFKRHGFSKVTMNDISKACGKSRSSIYHYFKNKKEVFEAFVFEEVTSLIQDASLSTSDSVSIKDNLYNYNSIKLKRTEKLINEYHNIIEELRDQPEIFTKMTQFSIEEEIAIIRKILHWGIVNKEIAKLDQKEIEFLSSVLVTAFRSFDQELILYNKSEDMNGRLRWLINILCKGLI